MIQAAHADPRSGENSTVLVNSDPSKIVNALFYWCAVLNTGARVHGLPIVRHMCAGLDQGCMFNRAPCRKTVAEVKYP